MIAIDTNLLIYGHRAGTPQHTQAQRALEQAAATPGGWGIAQPCLAEFWAVVTHPTALGGPSTPDQARLFITSLLRDGSGLLWQPGPGFGPRLLQLAAQMNVAGPRIFDLQIGLIAFENGATEIWSHDQNFVTVPGLRLFDPLRVGA